MKNKNDLLRKAMPIMLLLSISVSLINADTYGEPSLFAYFLYSISVCAIAVLVSFLIFFDNSFRFKITLPVLLFLLLTLYIFLSGVITHSLSLSHYYWLTSAMLLLLVSFCSGSIDSKQKLPLFLKGILIVAIAESVIVIMQWAYLLPVANKYFSATGTWVNPNVTAMFLAMSLFSVNNNIDRSATKTTYSKMSAGILLFIILSAIVLLHCRSAYIISGVFIMTYCWHFLKNHVPRLAKLNTKLLAVLFAGAIVFFSIFLSFYFKEASTNGRLQIWKNCLPLIAQKPFTGYGFGQFEKEYNFFVASNNLPGNDHVYMPYNDFLELAVEGGVLAVILWVAFLVSLVIQLKRNSWGLAVVASFIIIQLTNFGFQAIPAFALFLVYMGFNQSGISISSSKKVLQNKNKPLSVPNYPLKTVALIAIICCILLSTKLLSISNAFHQTKIIGDQYSSQEAVDEYKSLSHTLHFSSSYHEKYGDAFMQIKNYLAAKSEYQQALLTTSNPNVFGKCGWCYGQLGEYDSAAYYFKTIEKLQPYKFAPRMALLQLYKLQRDTIMIKQKAQEILNMPVKVASDEVDKMKEAAKRVMNNLTIIN